LIATPCQEFCTVAHEPVKQAMNRIRVLSADEEARRLAFVRERALRDEVSLLNEAKREGREEGRQAGREEFARNLIAMNMLTDEQIAVASGLTEVEVKALREH
jgi:predicted transposase/invertase (TIGR01784 family)